MSFYFRSVASYATLLSPSIVLSFLPPFVSKPFLLLLLLILLLLLLPLLSLVYTRWPFSRIHGPRRFTRVRSPIRLFTGLDARISCAIVRREHARSAPTCRALTGKRTYNRSILNLDPWGEEGGDRRKISSNNLGMFARLIQEELSGYEAMQI